MADRSWENHYVARTNKSEVPVDRRVKKERRAGSERRQKSEPVGEERRQGDRRKVQRRRQIDPTTCERDYTDEEIEFMQALDAYKRANGRMFPTCSEILEVIRDMGYVRMPQEDVPADDKADSEETNQAATAEPADASL